MAYKIVFHPLVERELREIYDWYEERLIGLGNRFIILLDRKLQELSLNPELHAKVKRNFRTAIVSRFPYIITYEINKKENEVFVSSVLHKKQKPASRYRSK